MFSKISQMGVVADVVFKWLVSGTWVRNQKRNELGKQNFSRAVKITDTRVPYYPSVYMYHTRGQQGKSPIRKAAATVTKEKKNFVFLEVRKDLAFSGIYFDPLILSSYPLTEKLGPLYWRAFVMDPFGELVSRPQSGITPLLQIKGKRSRNVYCL